jgi:site-specific DNA recombinase
VLNGLSGSILTPELIAEFIPEYQREWNRLQSERGRETATRTRRLADVKRRIAGPVDAIERGIITATTKERLLEAEKTELEQAPPLPSIHPNVAEIYRGKVARLQQELTDPEVAADANPVALDDQHNRDHTRGQARSGCPRASRRVGGNRGDDTGQEEQRRDAAVTNLVVAGVGFEPTTFRL